MIVNEGVRLGAYVAVVLGWNWGPLYVADALCFHPVGDGSLQNESHFLLFCVVCP